MASQQYGGSVGLSDSTNRDVPAGANDRRGIEQCIQNFVAAWNRHDTAAMAQSWAEDGDLINPFGRVAKGRDQVQQLFRDEHAGPFKTCSHQMKIGEVRMLGSDTAIADGDCTLTGARGPDGKEMRPFTPHVFFVMRKNEGQWQIIAARPYSFASMPGKQ